MQCIGVDPAGTPTWLWDSWGLSARLLEYRDNRARAMLERDLPRTEKTASAMEDQVGYWKRKGRGEEKEGEEEEKGDAATGHTEEDDDDLQVLEGPPPSFDGKVSMDVKSLRLYRTIRKRSSYGSRIFFVH